MSKRRLAAFLSAPLAAVLAALYAVAWTEGAPGPFSSYGMEWFPERSDGTVVLAFFAVLTTFLAITAGMLELREALPRQTLELEAFVEWDDNPTPARPDYVHWGLRLRCVGAIVSAYSVEWELLPRFMGAPQNADVHRGERLFPDQYRQVIAWGRDTPGDVPEGSFRARWWTDRNRGDWREYVVPTREGLER